MHELGKIRKNIDKCWIATVNETIIHRNGIGPVDLKNPGSDKKNSVKLTLMLRFPNRTGFVVLR